MEIDLNIRQEAEKLRKGKKYKEALELYRKTWKERDEKIEAGSLYCLRKLGEKEKALNLAKELEAKHSSEWQKEGFNWIKSEVIWTYIQFILNNNKNLAEVEQCAEKILNYLPDELPRKKTIFAIIKVNKSQKKWDKVIFWSDKLEPEKLNDKLDESSENDWPEQARWYNAKITALVELNRCDEALELLSKIKGKYPKINKYFIRLEASALHKKGKLKESEELYKTLCLGHKVDWWIKADYARLVKDLGRPEEALNMMYDAARSNRKLEMDVSVFEEIGEICERIGKEEEALDHYILEKFVRIDAVWKVPNTVEAKINMLKNKIVTYIVPKTKQEALTKCQQYWGVKSSEERKLDIKDDRKPRRDLIGSIFMTEKEKVFCYIVTGNEKIYCLKEKLPKDCENNAVVKFDAIPSFDKKKNIKSWKAINVKKEN
ncbi:MAG: hypothetical protein KA120_00465 [Candidatus Goldbacteria bacterium]|nr:hypothetical protein [Candidatus Goldiibacteriota bacterium]